MTRSSRGELIDVPRMTITIRRESIASSVDLRSSWREFFSSSRDIDSSPCDVDTVMRRLEIIIARLGIVIASLGIVIARVERVSFDILRRAPPPQDDGGR